MSMTSLPLTIWALFFTAVLGVLSFPVLFSGFILIDVRQEFWNQLLPERYLVNNEGLKICRMKGVVPSCSSTYSGSWAIRKYILSYCRPWVWSSEILSVNSRKPIFGYMAMVGFIVRDRDPGLPGLGAPYVCNGA
jgi:cytochrome c oxidase subunit 1